MVKPHSLAEAPKMASCRTLICVVRAVPSNGHYRMGGWRTPAGVDYRFTQATNLSQSILS